MPIKAVIFDLDGVIVNTDEYHYQGWRMLADEMGIYFDREINNRLRGVSRMESLEILLEKSKVTYLYKEKEEMAARKNNIYRDLLNNLNQDDILPGVMSLLYELKNRGIKTAVASSSKNAGMILSRIGLDNFFDAVVDGNSIDRSKPDPEVFNKAAFKIGFSPEECLVVEDAESGVSAAVAAGMWVLAVGFACGDSRAQLSARDLCGIKADEILSISLHINNNEKMETTSKCVKFN